MLNLAVAESNFSGFSFDLSELLVHFFQFYKALVWFLALQVFQFRFGVICCLADSCAFSSLFERIVLLSRSVCFSISWFRSNPRIVHLRCLACVASGHWSFLLLCLLFFFNLVNLSIDSFLSSLRVWHVWGPAWVIANVWSWRLIHIKWLEDLLCSSAISFVSSAWISVGEVMHTPTTHTSTAIADWPWTNWGVITLLGWRTGWRSKCTLGGFDDCLCLIRG